MESLNRKKETPLDSKVSCLKVSNERYTIISSDNTDAWISSKNTVTLHDFC